ncbi:hypothetical protein Y032_0473g2112 [Ancylostoma ceylanicum]|uniref:Reverse transcriptase domain-containing protein n=1 Tax=Ancylostoma ceylanicum TaxID=53326 RepID=A0A016WXW4_9BILA|nr:hypothetical protein Y032_0473g2112 [Ancylostoma ceylanicum]
MYADDIKIYKAVRSAEDSYDLQSAINRMLTWANAWQLPLSPHKTLFMHLDLNGSMPTFTYCIEGHQISEANSDKDLGFVYDRRLDFSGHYLTICRRAYMRTFRIFKALSTSSKPTLLRSYKTYARPMLESGTTVFNPSKKKDIYALEKVQNNFTRKLLARIGGFLTLKSQGLL